MEVKEFRAYMGTPGGGNLGSQEIAERICSRETYRIDDIQCRGSNDHKESLASLPDRSLHLARALAPG